MAEMIITVSPEGELVVRSAALQPVASAIGITVERAAVLLLALLLAAKWAIGLAFVR